MNFDYILIGVQKVGTLNHLQNVPQNYQEISAFCLILFFAGYYYLNFIVGMKITKYYYLKNTEVIAIIINIISIAIIKKNFIYFFRN